MLNELKNLKYPGGKDEIVYFLVDLIGNKQLSVQDIKILSYHAPGTLKLQIDALIDYCKLLEFIVAEEGCLFLNMQNADIHSPRDVINSVLVKKTVLFLFKNNIFTPELFFFDLENNRIGFRNERLSLSFSTIRNVLISQGFFDVHRTDFASGLSVNVEFEDDVTKWCNEEKKRYTLSQLKQKLQHDSEIGTIAEKYVYNYEKKRIVKYNLNKQIRIVSEIDVCAGYDIVSFESDESKEYDRFIEVKAISASGFFWSSNEYETAKLKGERYFLYLVDIGQIDNATYTPIIIKNPVSEIMKNKNWLVEVEKYHISHI